MDTQKIEKLTITTRLWLTILILVVMDTFSLLLGGALALQTILYYGATFTGMISWNVVPILAVFLLAYTLMGLYPEVALSPANTLFRIVLATSMVYLALGIAIIALRGYVGYHKYLLLIGWGYTVVLMPLVRTLIHALFAHRKWWGYPVVILGGGKNGRILNQILQTQPRLGLKPIAILDDDPEQLKLVEEDLITGSLETGPFLARKFKIPYAIVAMPGVGRERLLEVLELYGQTFPKLIVIPNVFEFFSLGVVTKNLGNILGFEVRQWLLTRWVQTFKRGIDIIGALVGILLFFIFGLMIAILIKFDSPGPVFFTQTRLGKNGRWFRAMKFRTMYIDAHEHLDDYLDKNPEYSEEYKIFHKLYNDPRATRVGRILRQYSLDEFPQFWNVLKGEMSLVGPRPYIPDELLQMNGNERIILRVLPGVTGLWQVSGRSTISFQRRLELEVYYVRNWSLWLDIYLIIRTFMVLLGRFKGS